MMLRFFSTALLTCLLVSHPALATDMPTCKTTVATYNGNLGGYAGANAKCAAEYAGYRMARNERVAIYSYDTTPSIGGWVGMNAQCGSSYTCSNWTSSSGAAYGTPSMGTLASPNCSISPPVYAMTCDTLYPIMCCNF